MEKYTLKTDEMNRIMELLLHVLDMRVTFFDIEEQELNYFNIKDMSDFCKRKRVKKSFDQKCIECDKHHIAEAKKSRNIRIYQCHAGLWEGIVPIYNRHGVYLGCIFYGQLPDRKDAPADVRSTDTEEMTHVGNLLKYLGEYISENELIRQSQQPWALRLEQYIQQNLTTELTLEKVSSKLGCSISYLTHKFSEEFGMPFKKYLRHQRLARGAELLKSGKSVSECASLSGYKNQFYFSNDFKKVYNISPLHYRRQFERNNADSQGK